MPCAPNKSTSRESETTGTSRLSTPLTGVLDPSAETSPQHTHLTTIAANGHTKTTPPGREANASTSPGADRLTEARPTVESPDWLIARRNNFDPPERDRRKPTAGSGQKKADNFDSQISSPHINQPACSRCTRRHISPNGTPTTSPAVTFSSKNPSRHLARDTCRKAGSEPPHTPSRIHAAAIHFRDCFASQAPQKTTRKPPGTQSDNRKHTSRLSKESIPTPEPLPRHPLAPPESAELPPKNPASEEPRFSSPCFQIKHPPRSTTGPLRIPNLSANVGSTDPELRCRWKKTEKQSREGTSGLENRNRIRQDQVTDNNIAIARTQRSAHPSESVAPDELAMRANRAIRKLPIQNHGHRPKTKAHKPTQPHWETLSPRQNTPQNRREPADCRARNKGNRNEGNRNQKGPWKTGRQKPAPSSSTSEPAGTRPAQQHT